MVDAETGWSLEPAKYSETYPYSHVKITVVGGKTVVTSGFNHEYRPLPVENGSGLGEGDCDTGIFRGADVPRSSRC